MTNVRYTPPLEEFCMKIDQTIAEFFREAAENATIEYVYQGLGYSAVLLSDGRCGICYTPKATEGNCMVYKDADTFEGEGASNLLSCISDANPLKRSMAIALVNALYQEQALLLDQDKPSLHNNMNLKPGAQVAMIGYFAPIIKTLKDAGIEVRAFDYAKTHESEESFYQWAKNNCDALILSATSLINASFESVLSRFSDHRVPTVLMGPSTIMAKELYQGLPLDYLAGSAVLNTEGVLKSIRNGRGTPYIQKDCKKVWLKL